MSFCVQQVTKLTDFFWSVQRELFLWRKLIVPDNLKAPAGVPNRIIANLLKKCGNSKKPKGLSRSVSYDPTSFSNLLTGRAQQEI